MKKPLVYVAGPYSSDPVTNTRRAVAVGDLLEAGCNCAVFIPHLSMLWDLISPAPYEVWLDRDNHILERCDAVYRIDGESSGADKEVAYAESLGIPVFYYAVNLRDFCEDPTPWQKP